MELYANDSRGVYIPQYFAESVKRECVQGVSEETWKELEAGPYSEHYWDAWTEVLDNATVTDPQTGRTGYLYQNGDLWIIYHDEEVPEEFFEG